jgi:hypothetical protein
MVGEIGYKGGHLKPYSTVHMLRLAFAYITFIGQTFYSKKIIGGEV